MSRLAACLLCIFAIFFRSVSVSAQERELILHRTDADSSVSVDTRKTITAYSEPLDAASAFIQGLRNEGYLAASLDSFRSDGNNLHLYYYKGEQFVIENFEIKRMSRRECRKAGISKRKISGKLFTEDLTKKVSEKIVFYYASQGYPFCKSIPEIEFFENGRVSLTYEVYKQEPVSINSVYIKGDLKSSDNFVMNYLNIHPGDLYNEQLFRKIPSAISELNFIREIRSPVVEFYDNKADVYLYLENRPANRFSGILGLANDSLNDNALNLTGDLSVELYDSFKQGEFVSLQWNRIKAQAQLLDLRLRYPYPWGLPLELSAGLLFDKTDSTYLALKFSAGADYIFPNGNSLIMGVSILKSSALSRYENSEIQTVSHSLFQAGYASRKLDYLYNPSSGYAFKSVFGTGNRKFESEREALYTAEIDFALYLPLYKKFVLKTGLSHRSLFSEKDFYRNELYKFGGNKSIRGFDENAFEALNYTVLRTEIRLLYEKDAALFVFSDLGSYSDIQKRNNLLWGFGPGVNISTKAGIFSLSYALGKRKNSPLQLADSKVHIAFVSRF
jgi:outer membrane protein assembly factor BamA